MEREFRYPPYARDKGEGFIFIPEKNSPPPDILDEYKEQMRGCKNISLEVPHRLTHADPLIEKAQETQESQAKICRDKNILLTTPSQNRKSLKSL